MTRDPGPHYSEVETIRDRGKSTRIEQQWSNRLVTKAWMRVGASFTRQRVRSNPQLAKLIADTDELVYMQRKAELLVKNDPKDPRLSLGI